MFDKSFSCSPQPQNSHIFNILIFALFAYYIPIVEIFANESRKLFIKMENSISSSEKVSRIFSISILSQKLHSRFSRWLIFPTNFFDDELNFFIYENLSQQFHPSLSTVNIKFQSTMYTQKSTYVHEYQTSWTFTSTDIHSSLSSHHIHLACLAVRW